MLLHNLCDRKEHQILSLMFYRWINGGPERVGSCLRVVQLSEWQSWALSLSDWLQISNSQVHVVFLNPEELLHLLVMQFFPGVLEWGKIWLECSG